MAKPKPQMNDETAGDNNDDRNIPKKKTGTLATIIAFDHEITDFNGLLFMLPS